MEDFYITLVSDACGTTFPNNLITDFRNILSHPIELSGHYEVALVNCTYVHSNARILKGEEFLICKYSDKTEVSLYTTTNIVTLQDLYEEFKKVPPPYDLYNITLKENGEYNVEVKAYFKETSPRLLYWAYPWPTTHMLAKRSLTKIKKAQIFIYCDLIDHRRTGESMTPLLRNFAYKGQHDSIVNHEFEHNYYFPVKTQRIETIRCYIRHENNTPPSLNIQPFTATLHFRKRL